MNEWKEIETQQDIDELIDIYGGFHDSCLVKANFQSGAGVSDNLSMGFGEADDYALHAVFERQSRPKTLELNFIGLRRCHIVGYEAHYFAMFFEAYIAFVEDLLPGEPNRLIVWSEEEFMPAQQSAAAFEETDYTYIIANRLQWRIAE